ncbi:flavin reductase family protein [Streptomyces sp. NPDC085529]|uniref:flavin reductase family protein n=1 Tax=Streptomyces sp. NPDC085529 TaxID=3365729 RepID=UPI0037D80758
MVSDTEFRTALARFPSGVTLVTARGERAGAHGLTVSAFCSVSLDPPLVLACVARSSRTLAALHEAGRFGVSLLGAHHHDVAARFASKDTDKFTGEWAMLTPNGSPVLPDALFAMECTVHQVFPAGDHEVVVGAVETVSLGEGVPLVYHDRTLGLLAGRQPAGALASVGAAAPRAYDERG